jgi:hypothetical protein
MTGEILQILFNFGAISSESAVEITIVSYELILNPIRFHPLNTDTIQYYATCKIIRIITGHVRKELFSPYQKRNTACSKTKYIYGKYLDDQLMYLTWQWLPGNPVVTEAEEHYLTSTYHHMHGTRVLFCSDSVMLMTTGY